MKAYVVELRTRKKSPVYIGHHEGSLITVQQKERAVLFDSHSDAHIAAIYWMLGTEDIVIHKVDVTPGLPVYRSRLFLSPVEQEENILA
jgi:hypothetical protein